MFNEKLKKVAEDVDAEEGQIFWLVKVEVGVGHVGVGDGEQFSEDEPRLVQRAHPSIEVIGGKGDLEMILVLRVRHNSDAVASHGFTGGGEEMMKFGGDEALPVLVGFSLARGGVGKKPVADAGGIALVEDFRQTLEAVEEDRIEAAEAEALGAVGLEAEMFHSDFSRWARSW